MVARAVEDTDSLLFGRGDWRSLGGALAYLFFDVLVLWTAFFALHIHGAPPFAPVLMAYIIGALGGSLPLPAGLGAVGGIGGCLILYGAGHNVAVGAAVVYGAVGLVVPFVGGLAASPMSPMIVSMRVPSRATSPPGVGRIVVPSASTKQPAYPPASDPADDLRRVGLVVVDLDHAPRAADTRAGTARPRPSGSARHLVVDVGENVFGDEAERGGVSDVEHLAARGHRRARHHRMDRGVRRGPPRQGAAAPKRWAGRGGRSRRARAPRRLPAVRAPNRDPLAHGARHFRGPTTSASVASREEQNGPEARREAAATQGSSTEV